MTPRRAVLAAPALLLPRLAAAEAASFASFLNGFRAEARRAGVSEATLQAALSSIHANQKVLELDRRQPEFTLTWSQYRASRVSESRIANGRTAAGQTRATLQAVEARFGVAPSVIMGIWGLETNYGGYTGGFNVVEALATLAWEGRRASYFRPELLTALKILDNRDITPAQMTGSYAGAMGQPQFMPTSYPVDFDGDGRRDIWTSRPDTLASIANYLRASGWRANEPWGQPIRLPPGFDSAATGRDRRRSLGEWMAAGEQYMGPQFVEKDRLETAIEVHVIEKRYLALASI